ncbi:hypothetical protein AGABI2DRAFT_149377 [Agaricus bisporus var. bisporus H97]|uniref:hypothetical protein n=1 Tax=Agaricus bisporus var. bisporus (strain H97 / ATCC MYA-4626 / FGSC 10389) TaxID=936046 RepID=UPI00029F5F76|nr:hypothetical protein AGABI2DRAFT_149377 [Agaricus bisporus var. bisporus H97]EKV49129.1 hypothetical protein AGABI2DRAFT_149377 [Agaricus bisporus var. bisporus H97]
MSSQPPAESSQPGPLFKVFKPTDSQPRLPPPLPDEYFVPTAADLKDAQSTLTARTKALVDAPLQSRAVREAAEKSKRDRWPLTRIRIKFPDRTQLEKVFESTDKIKSVYAFVRELLKDDVKPIKFILYQSPPKRDFKVSDPKVKALSLSELQLSPASILLLRFEEESLNHVNVTAPLLPEVLSKAIDLPIPPAPESVSQKPSPTPIANSSSTASKPLSGNKIPKWLKIGS